MTEAFLQATTLFHYDLECGDISGPLDRATGSCTTSSNSSNVYLVIILSRLPCLRCWNLANEGYAEISEDLSYKGVNLLEGSGLNIQRLVTRHISLHWPKLRSASVQEGLTSRRLQSEQTLPSCPPRSQLEGSLISRQAQLMQRAGNHA